MPSGYACGGLRLRLLPLCHSFLPLLPAHPLPSRTLLLTPPTPLLSTPQPCTLASPPLPLPHYWALSSPNTCHDLNPLTDHALPSCQRFQVVTDEAILHTTLARVVIPPRAEGDGQGSSGSSGTDSSGGQDGAGALALQRAVQRMTEELCGVEALLDKLW